MHPGIQGACTPNHRPPPTTSNHSSSYYISLLHPLPNSSPSAKLRPPGRRTHPPLASLCRLTLSPTRHASFCHQFLHPFVPLFLTSDCTEVPTRPWGVRPSRIPPSLLSTRLTLHVLCSKSWYLLVIGFLSGGSFFTRARGQGTSTP